MAGTVLAVTGLKREGRIVTGPGIVAVSGGGARALLEERIATVVQRQAAAGQPITAMISIGLGGALAPGLLPGAVVIASNVIGPAADGQIHLWPVSGAWARALAARLPGCHFGPVLASDQIIATASDKARLHGASAALAADMESHIAGEIAARLNLPFAVLRVISDGADRDLPPAAQVGMAAGGGINGRALAWSILCRPGQIPALIRTGIEAERGFRALLRCHRLAGPGLGFTDFRQLVLDMA